MRTALASLAGGMAAGLLLVSGMVLVEPVIAGAVVAPLVVEGVVVEGMVVGEDEEEGAGVVTVSSVFLLQPTSARAAARANAAAPADLRVDAYISVSF